MVHAADTREVARKELIERWDQERMARSVDSQIILTHTNDEVRELNQMARGKMRTAGALGADATIKAARSEEHTSELQSLMRISYAVFCLKKKTQHHHTTATSHQP